MFFTPNNGHIKGLNAVQGQLRAMSQKSSNLTRRYLANVMWAILDDICFHFLDAMSVSKLEGQPMSRIIFPESNINMIAAQMIQKYPLNFFTFPKKWTHKISGTNHTPRNSTGGGGRRAGVGGK